MTTETSTPRTQPRRLGGAAKRTVSTRDDTTEPVAPAKPAATLTSSSSPETSPEPSTPSARADQGDARRPRRRPAAARWDELERKEARLREDQVDELNRLARNLAKTARRHRDPGDKAERITDNTLIRVAVDLLLAQSKQLTGTTETELRKSVGL